MNNTQTLAFTDVHTLEVPSGTVTVTGAIIGIASSRLEIHHQHTTEFAVKGQKCRACRWHEVKIIQTATDMFAIHTVGRSIIPGEFTKCRLSWAATGYEVVELLTVRLPGSTFLPPSSARALAQAAACNRNIEQAYVNRAVP